MPVWVKTELPSGAFWSLDATGFACVHHELLKPTVTIATATTITIMATVEAQKPILRRRSLRRRASAARETVSGAVMPRPYDEQPTPACAAAIDDRDAGRLESFSSPG